MKLFDAEEYQTESIEYKFESSRFSSFRLDKYLNLMKDILLKAVEDIDTYQRYKKTREITREVRTNYERAISWIKSRDREYVFSFENISLELGGEPETSRSRIEEICRINFSEL